MIQYSFLPAVVLIAAVSASVFIGPRSAQASSKHSSQLLSELSVEAHVKQSETSEDVSGEAPEEDASVDSQVPEATEPSDVESSDDANPSEPASISDEELTQLASVLLTLQELQVNYRAQSLAAVQTEGLSPERFDQLLSMLRSPQAPENEDIPEATPEESGQFERALSQIGVLQDAVQEQAQQVILDGGFDLDRFQELVTALNTDQALEERVRQMMEATSENQG